MSRHDQLPQPAYPDQPRVIWIKRAYWQFEHKPVLASLTANSKVPLSMAHPSPSNTRLILQYHGSSLPSLSPNRPRRTLVTMLPWMVREVSPPVEGERLWQRFDVKFLDSRQIWPRPYEDTGIPSPSFRGSGGITEAERLI